MSENQQTAAQTGETKAAVTAPSFAPIESQEDFDKRVGERVQRERAKFADYDDIKAKAAEFDKVQEQSKSELQRAVERAEKAEQQAQQVQLQAIRFKVAAEKGVPADLLNGTSEQELAASADALIAFRGEQPTQTGPFVPAEGRSPSNTTALNGDPLERSLKDKLGIA